MINKYTLTFKDSKLENIFQDQMTTKMRGPLLKKIIICTALLFFIGLIEKLTSSDLTIKPLQCFKYSLCLFIEILFLVIYKYKQQYIKYALLLYNHVLVFQYSQLEVFPASHQIIFTGGIIIFQFVIALNCEFREAVYQTISFGAFYLFSAFRNNNQISYSLIAQILTAMVVLLIAFYENIKALRSQFKLGKIDDEWEQIFKSLVQDNYMVLYYNDSSYSFNLNQQYPLFNVSNTQELRDFLRNIKFPNKSTLEKELFKIIQQNKDNKHLVNQELKLPQNSATQGKIIYSIFYGFNTIILLQFKNYNVMQNNRGERMEILYQSKYKKFLKLIINSVKQFKLKRDFNSMICQLQKYCLYAHLKDILMREGQFYISQENVSQINCKKMVKTLQSLYSNKDIYFQNFNVNQMIGCQEFITLILIEIIEVSLSKYVNFQFEQDCAETFIIKVFCYYNQKSLAQLQSRINNKWPYLVNVSFDLWYIHVTFRSFESRNSYKNFFHLTQNHIESLIDEMKNF